MTKHLRFTMKHGKYVDDLTGKEYDEKFESWNVCNLLNELSEENEQLKQSHKEILRDLEVTTFDKELLQKENEQLKERIKELETENEAQSDTIDGLHELLAHEDLEELSE